MMKIKILTEAGSQIGFGHLTRCSSLYDEAIRRGIEIELVVNGDMPVPHYFGDRQLTLFNWMNTEFLEKNIHKEDYVIVDSYFANKQIYEIIAKQSKRAIYIDDTNRISYPTGIIVNPSLNGFQMSYPNMANQTILAGPKYVILRKAFVFDKLIEKSNQVKRVLIMMGGTDVKSLTSSLVSKLAVNNNHLIFDIVVSSSKYDYFTKNLVLNNVNYLTNLDEDSMVKLMAQADIAITAAGQTLHELIALNIPFLAIKVAENQQNNIKAISNLISEEIIIDSDDSKFMEKVINKFSTLLDYTYRREILTNMQGLIDGMGSKRIIEKLLSEDIIIRLVEPEDIKPIFELSNQDSVRKHSINKAKISWAKHVKWFNTVIKSGDVIFFVITNITNDILGQVRFNLENNGATISISVDETIRGKGLATRITSECISKMLAENRDINKIIAFVSKENIPSTKLFKRLGFEQDGFEGNMMKLVLMKGAYNVT